MRALPLARVGAACLVALSLAPFRPAAADTDVEVSAEVRTRYEADDRSFQDRTDFAHTIFQRSRVRLDLKHGDGAEAVIEFQDSRIWGDEGSTVTDTENVDLRQGFLRFRPGELFAVDAGRQALSYGRERVVGDFDWDNVGRAFDAVRVSAEFADEGWLDVFFGKVADLDVGGVDENVFGGFAHLDAAEPGLEFEPFVLYKENTAAAEFLTSFGTYANWGRDRFWADGDVVIQTGRMGRGDAGAYLVALDLSADFSPDADRASGASIGWTRYSGDDPADADDSAYDPLYPTNHGYFGIMDRANVIADRLGVGLNDLHAKIWFEPADGVRMKILGNVFTADVDTSLGSGRDGKDVGKELDVVIQGRLWDGAEIEVGGGYFLSGDLIEAVFDDENATWAYVQAKGSF